VTRDEKQNLVLCIPSQIRQLGKDRNAVNMFLPVKYTTDDGMYFVFTRSPKIDYIRFNAHRWFAISNFIGPGSTPRRITDSRAASLKSLGYHLKQVLDKIPSRAECQRCKILACHYLGDLERNDESGNPENQDQLLCVPSLAYLI